MTHEEWKALATSTGLKLKEVYKITGISGATIFNAVDRSENKQVPEKYVYMIKGLLNEPDSTMNAYLRHRNNPAVLALLKELDRLTNQNSA